MINPGNHNAHVVLNDKGESCSFGHSELKGTPYVAVNFEIVDGDEAGHRIEWRGYFTDGSADRTIQALRTAGFDSTDLTTYPAQKPDALVSLSVEHEEYNGNVRARVAWVNRPKSGDSKGGVMDANALRVFAAQMKAKLAAPAKEKAPF